MGSPDPLPPPPGLALLAETNPIALFLDFDGTLVDIADRPELIDVPATLPRSLLRLADALGGRLAVVSGRSVADLQRHLGDIPLAFGGSHGLEVLTADGKNASIATAEIADRIRAPLEAFVSPGKGLLLETKTLGAAVHYRGAPDMEGEVLDLARRLADQHGLAIKRGKYVIELVPHGASKAAAVRAMMQHIPFRDSVPVFVGDDLTDEDGFTAATELGGFGIAVGERVSKNARYHLASPDAVREWSQL